MRARICCLRNNFSELSSYVDCVFLKKLEVAFALCARRAATTLDQLKCFSNRLLPFKAPFLIFLLLVVIALTIQLCNFTFSLIFTSRRELKEFVKGMDRYATTTRRENKENNINNYIINGR